MLEAVQKPVGVGGIAARLELPEPDEPRSAGVGRLFEQMLEVAPKPGRDPLGDARFEPGAPRPPARRRRARSIVVVAGRMVRVSRQASTNLRTKSSFDCACSASVAEPLDELTSRATRDGPESV
jgi:hypothetical protein